jgi:hypothetical protein
MTNQLTHVLGDGAAQRALYGWSAFIWTVTPAWTKT